MITGMPNEKEKTLEECIKSLECLLKNSQGSDYNYQLQVSDSAFNVLKKLIKKEHKALEIIKKAYNFSFLDEDRLVMIDDCYGLTFVNQDEYDLLKDVLR